MQLCTKAALREQQWVRYGTEPGVWEMCQVRPKWQNKRLTIDQEDPSLLPLRVFSLHARPPPPFFCTRLHLHYTDLKKKKKKRHKDTQQEVKRRL